MLFLRSRPNPPDISLTQAIRSVSFGDGTSISVTIAGTDAKREQGLSDTSSLLPGTGMLFVFDTSGKYGFWMKDMQYPIDIIWIDTDGRIITVAPNVRPDTYPDTVFYPLVPATYVLEVNAGFSALHRLETGQSISIIR